ncbi:hypothetical protein [Streptomyces regalis]|uniref:Uncharacterized protein n=1 Tax=Streptomyces regalis TaxID=68262 RepID=A0A117MRN8_9ACTN|nr:hypothetical protein [Streptomyces regalis]KUL32095.1 hypothetical protein ADL12_23065 [Streptomyces regalis]
MEEPQQSSPEHVFALRRLVPPPALCGFLLLLALVFTVSYAAGAAVGPVAPDMQRSGTSGEGTGGTEGGMDMQHGSGG